MSGNIIQLNQDLIHTELKDLVKNSVEETLNAMLDAEADKLVQAERYARDEQRKGYRAGHYDRSFSTTAGNVNLRMPKLKGLPLRQRLLNAINAVRLLLRRLLLKCIWPVFRCAVSRISQKHYGVPRYLQVLSVTSIRKHILILMLGGTVA